MTTLLRLSAGLIVWAAGFCVIYGLHGIGCANDWPARFVGEVGLHQLAMILVWVAAITLNTGIAVRLSKSRRGDVLHHAAVMSNWAAVAATAVTFLPVLTISQCL